jgi:hypothetical protein
MESEGDTMAVRFGVFVPQGWRRDLVEIDDSVAHSEARSEKREGSRVPRTNETLGEIPRASASE